MKLKQLAPKQILGNKGDRKAKAQSHGRPENAVRSKPLTNPAYYKALNRGFIQCIELDDWLGAESDSQEPRRDAS